MSKKNFHKEYDNLFDMQDNRAKKQNRVFKIILSVILILTFVESVFVKIVESHDDTNSEYTYTYPLEEAGIKTTGTIDYSKSLSATIKDNTFIFNRGYQLTIMGDWDNSTNKKALSLLPEDNDDPDYVVTKTIADLTFYEGRYVSDYATISLSGNLLHSFRFSDLFNKKFVNIYPQKNLDDVLTGYIFYSESKEDSTIYRYFLFPDKTGILIEGFTVNEPLKTLTNKSNFEEFTSAFPKDYKFLSEDFIFEKSKIQVTSSEVFDSE
ncbi:MULTISPECIES: hypothetical protein [Enterococcus]|uniref:hypothetical protein n=1 Tax=Enterococcus sp. AZ103 TaxID=2774628 RepID=UPI003F22E417